MKIAFFGLPLAALLLDRDGHDIVLAAICRSDAVGVRRARQRFGERFVMKPDATRPAFVERVRALAPDLVVSWFWTKRLPMEIVRAAPLGGIGAHPSLLPRHRGPDPTYWAIASGDSETGVTVHRLEAEYDTGAMLASERLAIDPAWNAWQLARALDRPSLRLIRATVAAFARGEPPPDVAQDERLATSAPAPEDDACEIRWNRPTAEIVQHIRALGPAPGAWSEVNGVSITVTAARPAATYPAVLEPGEAVWDGERALVRTADGALDLVTVEIDGRPLTREELRTLMTTTGPAVLG